MARGGTVQAAAPDGTTFCQRPSRDAGKACSVASDCTSFCDPDTFTCSAEIPEIGCFSMLDDNGEEVTECYE